MAEVDIAGGGEGVGVASGNHEGLALRSHPPLDPSTPLPPRRICERVSGPSLDSRSGSGMTEKNGGITLSPSGDSGQALDLSRRGIGDRRGWIPAEAGMTVGGCR